MSQDQVPYPDQKGEIICQCFQITDETIKQLITSKNLDSIDGITESCGAGGGCQSCHILLDMFLEERQKAAAAQPDSQVKKKGFLKKLFARS
ncbi:MAG: (2Fe-2S)-binding protein [Nitrospinaceae bacterium]